MKKNLLFFFLLIFIPYLVSAQLSADSCTAKFDVPFSVNDTNITIWNGCEYVPVFINGINLGVSVPGTFPGQLAASREQYSKWFDQIREAGFNNIRVYTLHYPRFYEVLDSFNTAHPQDPLYIFQGLWLEETLPGYEHDLHFLSDTFDHHIRETLDCIHGNRTISHRFGKAYGTFDTDVSEWVLGYILGREVSPAEVLTTNNTHPGDTVYQGSTFTLPSGNPSEVWVTKRLNTLVQYERETYSTERPVSFSSWPTLDPLEHSEQFPAEDTASLDLANLLFADTAAGYFASYHAYPYYPDFISTDPVYQLYSDHIGQNSYLGYLYDLKRHYDNFPLIIAEFGVPSSWGVAHYSYTGEHHGGNTEVEQGKSNIRLLHNIQESNCGGGIQFAWINEWFKRTWITDPIDYIPSWRILWHNVTAAEQNFGLLKFKKQNNPYQLLDSFSNNKPITSVSTKHDYSYFHIKLNIAEDMNVIDSLWVGIDTYADSLGEKILPSRDTVENRAEFALKITNYDAELYVTQAYDLYGIWFNKASPEQLFHSVPTTGEPWRIVRWKNNISKNDVQYIGDLHSRRAELPPSSQDAVVISDTAITIRLPWSLLQFVGPADMKVLHDDRSTEATEDTVSDGIALSFFYHREKMAPDKRYSWGSWSRHTLDDVNSVKKNSFDIIKQRMGQFNSQPIAMCDSYITTPNTRLQIAQDSGLVANDFDIDGNPLEVELIDKPDHGKCDMSKTGAFTYIPDKSFYGTDYLTYRLYDGYGHSDTTMVYLHVQDTQSSNPQDKIAIYPNPAINKIHIASDPDANYTVRIMNIAGIHQLEKNMQSQNASIDISSLNPGIYIVSIHTIHNRVTKRLIVQE